MSVKSSSGIHKSKRDREALDETELSLEEDLFGDAKTISKNIKNENIEKDNNNNKKQIKLSKDQKAVWRDEEDEKEEEGNLKLPLRLKKLKVSKGSKLAALMKKRYSIQEDWNEIMEQSEEDNKNKEEEDFFTNDSGAHASLSNNNSKPKSHFFDISRLVDANISEYSNERITSVNFHSSNNIMLAAGFDKNLRIFKVDGEKNEKQISVKFQNMPIYSAAFIPNSSEIILSGRKPFFHVYDCESGHVSKIFGSNRTVKSYENISVSPCGNSIGVMGVGGYVSLLDGKSKLKKCEVKMNTPARSFCFNSENLFITSGLDSEVYLWDLRYAGRCFHRFKNEDGLCNSSLASFNYANRAGNNNVINNNSNGSGQIAVGSESGVVSMYNYNSNTSDSNGNTVTELTKALMNLTTKITLTKFHPSGEYLAIASGEKADQLRIVHAPTCRVYNNWPTRNTPTRRVECLDFSQGGAFMAVGNNKGKVLLYRLNHFDNA